MLQLFVVEKDMSQSYWKPTSYYSKSEQPCFQHVFYNTYAQFAEQ